MIKTNQGIPRGMKPGRREMGPASLDVCISGVVPASMSPMVREVINFKVAAGKRGKRLGTMLMNLVCQEADANGITLLLTAEPDAGEVGPNREQLVKWYQKFGFIIIQETPTGPLMARQVLERSRILQPVH